MNRRAVLASLLLFAAITTIQAKVIRISDEDQYNNTLKSNKNMLVKFSADWCSVCNGIEKSFEDITDEKEFDHVAFADVNIDKFDELGKKNGIVGVPTFVYVENGNKKVEEIGVQNMPAFKDHLRENLRKTFKVAQNEAPTMDAGQEPTQEMIAEAVAIDVELPAEAPPAAEPNFFMKIVDVIKNFFILIFEKIKEFFTTIIDAIKGFFGM